MAVIKCKECNGTVSDKAYSCPHCGYIFETKKRRAMSSLAKLSLVGVAIIIGFIVFIQIILFGSLFFMPVDL